LWYHREEFIEQETPEKIIPLVTPYLRKAGSVVQEGSPGSSPVCKDWALVGQNAFAHGGGIHQDGVLKDARTYEIMTPESIGLTSADRRMHMGKLSGRAALDAQMRELGYELEKVQLNRAFDMAKLMLGKKKVLEEMDMRYIAETAIHTTTVVELGNT
jgi:isopropylmalate/homocitrate/citramalate synthase